MVMIRNWARLYRAIRWISNDDKSFAWLQILIFFLFRNFLSQLEDERTETETRLEKMSKDMEGVYQAKVAEKLQKLDESKQNVNEKKKRNELNLFNCFLFFEGFENSRDLSIKYSTRRRTFTTETRWIRTFETRMGRRCNEDRFCWSNWFINVRQNKFSKFTIISFFFL